jgi:streptomycin 6-kinase
MPARLSNDGVTDTATLSIPRRFARTIVALHATTGVEWLNNLHALLDDCARHWSLTLGRPFARLSYNYVLRATRADGSRVVLKVGVPHRELLTEMRALHVFAGRGVVRLLEADERRGAMLLERLEPGASLDTISVDDDSQATSHAAAVMRRLWQPVPRAHTFPTVSDWGAAYARLRTRFGGGSGPLPSALFDEAERLFTELSDSSAAHVLLHGDLHHGNILSARRAPWLAVDPKGLVGEPAYEVGALLRNPLPQLLKTPSPRRVLSRRLDILSEELSIERERLRNWGVTQAVLSTVWSIEDGESGWQPTIACAELLRRA